MDIFVARQPIFNINEKVVSYELLFRSGYNNHYTALDGDQATSDVITNGFFLIGLNTLTNGKKAFVNFTENLLLNGVATLLPKDSIIIEILETVNPTDEIISACKNLKKLGYTLALDDFIFSPKYEPLLNLADIVKIDFLTTTGFDRSSIIKRYSNKNIKFLAEKVETREDFEEAVELGYSYFQGYFFSKPVIFSGQDIPINKATNIKLLQELTYSNLDFDTIQNIIKRDVSLTYKLLRFINSSAFGFHNEIKSIKQALALLGPREMTKLIYLIVIRNIFSDGIDEILNQSIIRARFGELIAPNLCLSDQAPDIFLMELLANIDVFLNRPMSEILSHLPISNDIKDALTGKNNTLSQIHELIVCYNDGNWNTFNIYAKAFKLNISIVPDLYIEALEWSKFFLKI